MSELRLEGHEERWKNAKTLPQVVWELYNAGKCRGEEFKAIVNFYGRERVKKILDSEARKRRVGERGPKNYGTK